MNEFRASLEDARRDSVSRDVFDSKHDPLVARVQELENSMVRQGALDAQAEETKKTRKALFAAIITGAFLTILNFIINAIQVANHRP